MMLASAHCLAFIAAREACVLVAYQDSHHLAIGFGDNDPSIKGGDTITLAEAVRRMEAKVVEYAAGVERIFSPRIIPQTKFDALVSLAWNIGVGGLRAEVDFVGAVEVALDNPHDVKCRDMAGLQWTRVKYSDQSGPFNLSRRCREAILFLTGGYGDLSALDLYRGNPHATAPERVPMPKFLGGEAE